MKNTLTPQGCCFGIRELYLSPQRVSEFMSRIENGSKPPAWKEHGYSGRDSGHPTVLCQLCGFRAAGGRKLDVSADGEILNTL